MTCMRLKFSHYACNVYSPTTFFECHQDTCTYIVQVLESWYETDSSTDMICLSMCRDYIILQATFFGNNIHVQSNTVFVLYNQVCYT